MATTKVSGGTVHQLPDDLRTALVGSAELATWEDITPLARNEFICWVEDAKQAPTRARRIRRTVEELEEGKRRPCCWPGCSHLGAQRPLTMALRPGPRGTLLLRRPALSARPGRSGRAAP